MKAKRLGEVFALLVHRARRPSGRTSPPCRRDGRLHAVAVAPGRLGREYRGRSRGPAARGTSDLRPQQRDLGAGHGVAGLRPGQPSASASPISRRCRGARGDAARARRPSRPSAPRRELRAHAIRHMLPARRILQRIWGLGELGARTRWRNSSRLFRKKTRMRLFSYELEDRSRPGPRRCWRRRRPCRLGRPLGRWDAVAGHVFPGLPGGFMGAALAMAEDGLGDVALGMEMLSCLDVADGAAADGLSHGLRTWIFVAAQGKRSVC